MRTLHFLKPGGKTKENYTYRRWRYKHEMLCGVFVGEDYEAAKPEGVTCPKCRAKMDNR